MVDEERVIDEYPIEGDRADYALLDRPCTKGGKPLILIEAKRKNAIPREYLPPVQLQRYVNMLPSCFIGAWTNGTTWYWFFLTSSKALGDIPFVQFDNTKDDWLSYPVLNWLGNIQAQNSKPNSFNLIHAAWRLNYFNQIRCWWKCTRIQPSSNFLQILWKEINTPAQYPTDYGFYDLGVGSECYSPNRELT